MNIDKRLLAEAARTIKETRRDNERLRLRLSGFEDALSLLRGESGNRRDGQGLCMAPDVVYDLEKRIVQIEEEESRADVPEGPPARPKIHGQQA